MIDIAEEMGLSGDRAGKNRSLKNVSGNSDLNGANLEDFGPWKINGQKSYLVTRVWWKLEIIIVFTSGKGEGEGYRPDLYGKKENSIRSRFKVMIWGCITWNGVGTLRFVDDNSTAEKYLEVLEKNLRPVIARHFSQRVLFSKMMELQYIPQGLSNPGGKRMPSPPSLGHLSAQTWIRSKIAGLLSKIVFNGRY